MQKNNVFTLVITIVILKRPFCIFKEKIKLQSFGYWLESSDGTDPWIRSEIVLESELESLLFIQYETDPYFSRTSVSLLLTGSVDQQKVFRPH